MSLPSLRSAHPVGERAPLTACLLYALGGGAGHAVRGACVARELVRRGVRVTLLVAEHARAAAGAITRGVSGEPFRLVSVQPQGAAALRAQVEAWAWRGQADMIWVDTFPDGILGELAGLSTPRLALLRVRRDVHQLKRQLAGCAFALDLEPNLRWLEHPRVVPIGPVARALTAAPLEADVGWVLSEPKQRPLLLELAARFTDVSSRQVEPSSPLTNGYPFRVVVGPAGYNLSYELARASVWHVALPAPRRFDRQAARASALGARVASPEALERRIRALLQYASARPAVAVEDHAAVVACALQLIAGASPHGGARAARRSGGRRAVRGVASPGGLVLGGRPTMKGSAPQAPAR